MHILAVDIGTGTQDILWFDTTRDPENCLKLVMPSPTLQVAAQIRRATAAAQPLLLTGVLMGGGPSAWAAEDHHKAGLPIWATAPAARSFNDDLEAVRRDLGIEVVSADEAAALARRRDMAHVQLKDFDYAAIAQAFAAFDLTLRPAAVAVAVFDHGDAPPTVSDRQFRLDYLAARLQANSRLSTFAFPPGAVPPIMTRLQAVVESAQAEVSAPLLVMDTAPAAVLGAWDDPVVKAHPSALIANVGNFHCLAFQYRDGDFVRLVEHHTGLLNPEMLTGLIERLADGSLRHEEVFAGHGHGAVVLDQTPVALDFVAVTGPRRAMLNGARLPLYLAVPHGDQMMAGCFGLLRACADHFGNWRDEIVHALDNGQGASLW